MIPAEISNLVDELVQEINTMTGVNQLTVALDRAPGHTLATLERFAERRGRDNCELRR